MKWQVHNETVIKTFHNVTTVCSYNLQMDNPHFSDIDEESAIINCLNPIDRKGSYKVWFWWKYTAIECTQVEGDCTAQCSI